MLVEQSAVEFAPGKVGKVHGKPLAADYVLTYRGWRDTFTDEPFWFGAGKKVRYYQELAVNHVLDAVAEQKTRMLLTLATGTGKTFIAFQIAWKLMRTRWNLFRMPSKVS